MVDIIFKLSFIEEVIGLASQPLHSSLFVYLSICLFARIFSNPHIIVDFFPRISDNIPCIQDSIFFPSLQHAIKVIRTVQSKNHVVISRFALEFICEDLRQLWRYLYRRLYTKGISLCFSMGWSIIYLGFGKSWWNILFAASNFVSSDDCLFEYFVSWTLLDWPSPSTWFTVPKRVSWRGRWLFRCDIMLSCLFLRSLYTWWHRSCHCWCLFVFQRSSRIVYINIVGLLAIHGWFRLSLPLWRTHCNSRCNVFFRHKVFRWLSCQFRFGSLFEVIISCLPLITITWRCLGVLWLHRLHSWLSIVRCLNLLLAFSLWDRTTFGKNRCRLFKFLLLLIQLIEFLCFQM